MHLGIEQTGHLTTLHASNDGAYNGSDSQKRSARGQCRKSPTPKEPLECPFQKRCFNSAAAVIRTAKLSQATLVIIDAQKEYLSGPLALSGMDAAGREHQANW